MNNSKKLSSESQERIDIRIDFSDSLTTPVTDIEKADFLLQMLQSEYTMGLPSERIMSKWAEGCTSICMLIDIVRDYTYKAQ